jgi:hypothetical protein
VPVPNQLEGGAYNEDILTNLDGVLEQVFAKLGQPT